MTAIIEDFVIGFIVGQVTAFFVGWWCLVVGIVTGLLYVAAGRGWGGTKLWRIVGVPSVIGNIVYLYNHSYWVFISYILQIIVSTEGWSLPDANQTKASPIGKFWWGKLQPNRTLAEVATRITWVGVVYLAMLFLFLK